MSGKRQPSLMQRLLREHTLYRYLTALEEGEIETIIAVMQQAADDPVLAQMIFEIHGEYQTEEELLTLLQEEESMEEKYGTTQSQPDDEAGMHREPEQSRRPLWLQALAAILLICILGGGFIWIQLWRNPHPPTTASATHQNGWCVVPGAPLDDSVGQSNLNAVAATSGSDVWAVGAYGKEPLIEHWDGQHWRASALRPDLTTRGGVLYSVATLAPNDIWAVGALGSDVDSKSGGLELLALGDLPLVMHWDGQQWKTIPNPVLANNGGYALFDVSALATNDVWAVGSIAYNPQGSSNMTTSSPLVEHWDGSQWSVISLPAALAHVTLNAITAITKNDVWVVGNTGQQGNVNQATQPLIAHWDGHQWGIVASPNGGKYGGSLYGITAITANDIWVMGDVYPDNGFEHWNGQQWSLVSNPKGTYNLSSMAEFSSTNIWAVGGFHVDNLPQKPPVVAHWNGKSWSSIQQPGSVLGVLNSITSAGGRLWAVGTSYSHDLQQIASTLIESNVCS